MKSSQIQPIHFTLMPIMLLLGLLAGVSIASSLIVIVLPISLFVKLAIIALIVVSSTFFILRDALLLLPYSWKTIDVDNKGELIMTNKGGQQFHLKPASNTFIHAACSVLNFEGYRAKYRGFRFALPPVILLPSPSNADELRRLRIWLRWFKHEKTQEDLMAADLAE